MCKVAYMGTAEAFPERLRELRSEAGLTQVQLSDRLALDRTTVSGYESGKSTPDVYILLQIADIFGVSVDFLLGLTDVRERPGQLNPLPKRTVGERLEALRGERGMDMESTARAIGVHVDILADIERGEVLPDAYLVRRAADFFSVSTDYLLGRTVIRNTAWLREDESVRALLHASDGLAAEDFLELTAYAKALGEARRHRDKMRNQAGESRYLPGVSPDSIKAGLSHEWGLVFARMRQDGELFIEHGLVVDKSSAVLTSDLYVDAEGKQVARVEFLVDASSAPELTAKEFTALCSGYFTFGTGRACEGLFAISQPYDERFVALGLRTANQIGSHNLAFRAQLQGVRFELRAWKNVRRLRIGFPEDALDTPL